MLSGMNRPLPIDSDTEVIDVDPPRRRRWLLWMLAIVLLSTFTLSRFVHIYVEGLWFDSLGYASVYWYKLRLQLALFAIFALATIAILRGMFRLLERSFGEAALARRMIMLNNQPVAVSPARFAKLLAWFIALFFGVSYGLAMSGGWQLFAAFLHRTPADEVDPIFQRPLDFYLFALPVYQSLASWLTVLAFIVLIGAVSYAALSLSQGRATKAITQKAYAAVSYALAVVCLVLAGRTFLARYSYLFQDHETFSGVTYTEANYLLPGLTIVAIALIVAALVLFINAFLWRRLRPLVLALAVPIAVYTLACILVPGYVASFIVKPNELDREAPYIEHNIGATRRAFALDRIETRDFEAESSAADFNLTQNRLTLDNLRLWDWRALQDTLRQMQEIRTYYDFPDVDVDRYQVGGQARQMMVAARELSVEQLSQSSRNWINERLIYTHGYGVTMNTANEFTPDGRPIFILSNMPLESAATELQVTRPQIYYGQRTDTDVYVRTKQREFDYPQGEENATTVYEGTSGIPVGNFFRRLLLAWAYDDLAKLPFSDDVQAESLALVRRNINERVRTLAPFLVYDDDPYIVVGNDGRLHWIIDAFTQSAAYPYSRHYNASGRSVNYLRNSVKAIVDAYDGTVRFYVFDEQDPLISTYRRLFPLLFRNRREMPADLLAHVRYPETLIRTQAEVYGLYHTENAKTFFQREDVWSVAREIGPGDNRGQETHPVEPYYLLMQLPHQPAALEFVAVLPFTPAGRNNLIGWMAGRSDGDAYGSLLVYNFPRSRLVDGPLQIEARIDQNAQLSSQLTLWNQQGSRVQRGNLLVIPMGRGLLYVEPIFLQAERSPMPELRLVVLATQDRLGYGTNFEEALTNLFGEASETARDEVARTGTAQAETAAAPGASAASAPTLTTQQLITRAAEQLAAYQRLTADGKLGEAGQQLESLKRTLDELNKQQR